jgi:enamine deaminase RidA (YjgF/YER057c/UK114 family)
MERTAVNPWDWGLQFSMNQGEVTTGASRVLRCSGQVAMAPDPDSEMGVSPLHPGDIRQQIEVALANVDAVLGQAAMERGDVVFLTFFTTDIDGFLANYDVYAGWISEAGTMPPQSLIGVSRLVMPELLVEIEVTAAR